MPIYEYGCLSCGAAFEKLMKLDAAAPPCPECGAEQVQKKVSAAGFVLKGSGWYRDHYGLKSGGGSSAEPSTSSDAESSSGETGTSSGSTSASSDSDS